VQFGKTNLYPNRAFEKTKQRKGKLVIKKIGVCLLILLALSASTVVLVPTAKSQIDSIKILSYSYYIDNLGLLDVVGEIQNVGTNTIGNVTIDGTITTADDVRAGSGCYALVSDLLPQQKAPFYMEFYPENTFYGTWYGVSIQSIDLYVSHAEPTSNYLYPDMAIESKQGSVAADGSYTVSGTVKNTGSQSATDVRVVATFYNSQNEVVAIGYTDPLTPNPVAPQHSASYNVGAFDRNQSFVPANQTIDRYALMVQVASPELQGTPPAVTPSPTLGPSTSNPSSTQPGNQPADTNFNSDILYAAVVAVVAVVVVLALLMLRKRKPSASQQKGSAKKNKRKK
jgi:hypothetical protein